VFEVPTTLEALHDMIGNYASTGNDASLIIQRIYAANSVRLDRRNGEKMQNFYDVLLRRFVAVGDAIHQSGDGGVELGRFKQLDELTKTMYAMAQDSADTAGAVWSRRLGIFQNAQAKRLRDAELERDEEDDDSAWPSVGVFLTLTALGHIFPVTDQRHHVVTPAVLLLGQMIAQTPVLSTSDAVLGTLCSGLMLEYTRGPRLHSRSDPIVC
jgi:nucleolar protein 14